MKQNTAPSEIAQEIGLDIVRAAKQVAPMVPTDEELALFACGWLNPDHAQDIMKVLMGSAKLRTRLLELRAHIAFAERGAIAQQQVLESEPVLKLVFGHVLKSAFEAFADWDRACADTLQGQNDSPAVWGGLKDLWSSIQRHRIVRVAASRSGTTRGPEIAQKAKVVVFPGVETADLYIERNEDDVLHAYARFTRPYQHPREICLYMKEDESGWIRLGGSLTFGTEWRCSIPFVSRALDLPVGPLETHYFALSEGRWSGEKRTVLLRVTESFSRPDYSLILRLLLKGPATVRNGRFQMTVVLPEEIRGEFADGRLDAGVQLSPSMYLVLGDWKVGELADGTEIELSCEMPLADIPDCDLDYHAGLRLSLGRA